MINHEAVLLALRARLLTLASLPTTRLWENKAPPVKAGDTYVDEDYVPATCTLRGLTSGGLVEDTGLYVVKWAALANTGAPTAIAGPNALLALFPPGLALTASDGSIVRIRGDIGPTRGQGLSDGDGRTVYPVTIPFRVHTFNPL